jgi:hypothetical protein
LTAPRAGDRNPWPIIPGGLMLRIQYEGIIQQLYKMIDEEFEIETEEGKKIFLALSQALFDCYISNKTEKVHIDG